MAINKQLLERSTSKCELCGAEDQLDTYTVAPGDASNLDENIVACATCTAQIQQETDMDANHWRCLNDSMWSQVPAVQVVAWRMLTRLRAEGWPQDLLDMMYMDEETLTWAKATGEGEETESVAKHKDCNGVTLNSGDSVVVIKDLNVKGSSLVAKRGTAVRNISLVFDNPEQIEGRVNGQQIVLLTKYVKKS